MTDLNERVAKVEAWATGHEDQCKERYSQIRSDTAEIKGSLLAMTQELKGAVSRIHERIDHSDKDVSNQRVWALSALLTGASAIIGWLVNHFVGKQ